MKFLLIATASILFGALLVNAGGYGRSSGGYNNNKKNNHGYQAQNTYNTHQNKYGNSRNSGYGPHHSYPVRPAIYGGYGQYHYQGYARHHAPGAINAALLPTYHHAPRQYPKQACHGYRCAPKYPYDLHPVTVLILAPAYSHYPTYSDGNRYSRAHKSGSGAGHGNHHQQTSGYRNEHYHHGASY